ncbi:hypothetical protein [Streptosporangium sp. NPDC049248]
MANRRIRPAISSASASCPSGTWMPRSLDTWISWTTWRAPK